MRMVDIISKKRDGQKLTKEEIKFFIDGYVDGNVPDYQASALAMAIFYKGMDKEEISILTDCMRRSGDIIDLSMIKGVKCDKHSTGGVGDKTSLVLGPMVASCGAKIAKMSGRGLGHTGGTLDKMESIPGMKISLTEEEFVNQVNNIGIAIVGQNAKLVPADKKLYALRDVTATVDSIPLIASSIMSKKLASGSDTIILDVKFGSGAFMKTLEKAKELAKTMVEIGKSLNKDTRAILTNMDQPLGKAVGNSLEVKEAIATLRGEGPNDLVELCTYAGSIMLEQAGIVKSLEDGRKLLKESITSGRALSKLRELIASQGGDSSYIDNPDKFEKSREEIQIFAENDGYIEHIDSLIIGEAAMKLGAGRETLDDVIDMSAGIYLNKKVGDLVKNGDLLCTLYTNKDDVASVINEVKGAYKYSKDKVETKIVFDYIK